MNNIYNKEFIVSELTPSAIAEALLRENPKDKLFCFSAAPAKELVDRPGHYLIRVNCCDGSNCYTPADIIAKATPTYTYVNAPLSVWLSIYENFIGATVDKAYRQRYYLFQDRAEVQSLLYFSICKAYEKGFYLHKHLIEKIFVNELNKLYNRYKEEQHFRLQQDCDLALCSLVDDDATCCAHDMRSVSTSELENDLYQKVKDIVLQYTNEFGFNRLMLQLRTHTVDTTSSRILAKVRKEMRR